jgi:regulatory protein
MTSADAPADRSVLRLSAAPGEKVRVRMGAARVADLAPASVVALGLRDGEEATPARASQIRRRALFEKSHARALAALARRPLARAALRERLARHEGDAGVVQDVLDALERDGLLNDRAVADAVLGEQLARSGAGAAFLESKLTARGVDASTARDAVRESVASGTPSALETARARVTSMPPDLSPPARARRLYAYLARRGFEEHEAADAVERILGVLPGPLD